MDIAALWRRMRADPAAAPHAGARLEAAEPGITISVAQECLLGLPPRRNRIPLVSVTITSQRPGVEAQVTIAANFNSADGSYQGPTTAVGYGQFTATNALVQTALSCCPPAFPCSAWALWPIGRTGHTARP